MLQPLRRSPRSIAVFEGIRRQVTLQEAPSPCFKVFAILSDLLSLPIGLEPTKHRCLYLQGFRGPPLGENYAVAPTKFRYNFVRLSKLYEFLAIWCLFRLTCSLQPP